MASGMSLAYRAYSREMREREPVEWVQKERNRSLRGKARIKARKEARRDHRSAQ